MSDTTFQDARANDTYPVIHPAMMDVVPQVSRKTGAGVRVNSEASARVNSGAVAHGGMRFRGRGRAGLRVVAA